MSVSSFRLSGESGIQRATPMAMSLAVPKNTKPITGAKSIPPNTLINNKPMGLPSED